MQLHKIGIGILCIAMLVLAGCGGRVDRESKSFVDSGTGARADPGKAPPPPRSPVLAMGSFDSNVYHVAGAVAYVQSENGTALRMYEFQSEARAGTHVYLAKDSGGAQHIDIGVLRGYKGTYEYQIPPGTNVREYPYVVIYSTTAKAPLAAAAMG